MYVSLSLSFCHALTLSLSLCFSFSLFLSLSLYVSLSLLLSEARIHSRTRHEQTPWKVNPLGWNTPLASICTSRRYPYPSGVASEPLEVQKQEQSISLKCRLPRKAPTNNPQCKCAVTCRTIACKLLLKSIWFFIIILSFKPWRCRASIYKAKRAIRYVKE